MQASNYFKASRDFPYHLSVGAVIMNEVGQILVHHFWHQSFLGRQVEELYILMRETIEPGETPEQTLARGLQEEFGATGRPQHYVGSIVCEFEEDGYTKQKTTLYFICQLDQLEAMHRSPEDEEAGSTLEWHDLNFLREHMVQQGREIRSDVDESAILDRVQAWRTAQH